LSQKIKLWKTKNLKERLVKFIVGLSDTSGQFLTGMPLNKRNIRTEKSITKLWKKLKNNNTIMFDEEKQEIQVEDTPAEPETPTEE
jgi:hypothetical protein